MHVTAFQYMCDRLHSTKGTGAHKWGKQKSKKKE